MTLVRQAAHDDHTRILELLAEMHDREGPPPTDESRSLLDEILKNPHRRLLLVERSDGQVVGTVDVLVVTNLSRGGRPWAIVENLAVDSAHRRQGFGRLLMSTAIDFAAQSGCYKVQLISNAKRDMAHPLYEELGFAASVRGFRRYLVEM